MADVTIEELVDATKDLIADPEALPARWYLHAILKLLKLHQGLVESNNDIRCPTCGAVYGRHVWTVRQQTLLGGE